MTEWINFKALKKAVTLEMVLFRYGIIGHLKPSGKNLYGCCPIHTGTNDKQFSVNLSKNAWRCFGDCQSHGNQLDFVVAMERLSGQNTIRESALLLKNWFSADLNIKYQKRTMDDQTKNQNFKLVRKKIKDIRNERKKYKPIEFALNPLNSEHPFLGKRLILSDTAKYFGTGFYNRKGLMDGRIVFPIHDEKGKLWGYCGRAVSRVQAKSDGKYKLPPDFPKQDFVFNLHNQAKGLKRLIIVESFISVLRIHQCGIKNVVSILGSSLSQKQENLILNAIEPMGKIILMFDMDQSGRVCTDDCLCRFGRKAWVKAIDLPLSNEVIKPHQLNKDRLRLLLDDSKY